MVDFTHPQMRPEEHKRPLPPSRLRHTIPPPSSDDELCPADHAIQAPDSQTVVSETQLGHGAELFESVVEKDTTHSTANPQGMGSIWHGKTLEQSQEPVKQNFFRRPDAEGGISSSTPTSSFAFTACYRKGVKSKRPPVEGVSMSAKTTTLEHETLGHDKDAEDRCSQDKGTPVRGLSSTDGSVTYLEPANVATMHARTMSSGIAHVEKHSINVGEAFDALSPQHLSIHDIPTSTSPGHNTDRPGDKLSGLKHVKKSNKSKRDLHAEKKSGLWLPRTSHEQHQNGQICNDQHLEHNDILVAPMPKATYHDGDLHFTSHCAEKSDLKHEDQEAPQNQDNAFEKEAQNEGQISLRVSHTIGSGNVDLRNSEEFHGTHPASETDYATASIAQEDISSQIAHSKPRSDSLRDGNDIVGAQVPPSENTTIGSCQQAFNTASVAQKRQKSMKRLNSNSMSVPPHNSGNKQRPYRVSKPQPAKKTTAAKQREAAPIMARSLPAPGDALQILDALRFSLTAEKYLVDQEHRIESKRAEEVNMLLKDRVDAQALAIADWKNRYNGLQESIEKMRSGAKANQKYVNGLQRDHEKLQRAVAVSHEECRTKLQEKISEVEKEKADIIRELETTLCALSKSQTISRKTVAEFYERLIRSELERKQLLLRLENNTNMLAEEKAKRTNLEATLVSSMNSLTEKISTGSTNTMECFEALKQSLKLPQSGVEQQKKIDQCIVLIQKLLTIPFLTTKDVQKAEGMLRHVHTSVESQLKTLSGSIQRAKITPENIRNAVHSQLQHLQTDILKFEELRTQNHQVQEVKAALEKDLEAERQKTCRLSEQIETVRCAEGKLQERNAQLEAERGALFDKIIHHDMGTTESHQRMTEVLLKLQEREKECQASTRRCDELDRLNCNFEKELDVEKKKFEQFRGKLEQLRERITKNGSKSNDEKAVRDSIREQYQQEFARRESDLNNELHRLKLDRDHGLTRLRELGEQLNAAKSQYETLRGQNNDVTSKLRQELSSCHEELQMKNGENHELRTQLGNLQVAHKQLQEGRSQLLSDIERTGDKSQAIQADIKANDERISNLTAENKNLESMLELVRTDAATVRNINSAQCVELADLRAAKKEYDVQLRVQQKELDQTKKQNSEDIERLELRLRSSEAALKEAEAKNRLQAEEHSKKIDLDREQYERKFEEFRVQTEAQYADAYRCAPGLTKRRAVNRENRSILDMRGVSGITTSSVNRVIYDIHAKEPTTIDVHKDNSRMLFDEECQLDNQESSAGGLPKSTSCTEALNHLAISPEVFHKEISQACIGREHRQASSRNSSLSIIDSDDLAQLEIEQQPRYRLATPLAGLAQVPKNMDEDCGRIVETPVRSGHAQTLESEFQSSASRPRSQANTASRLKPPHQDDVQSYKSHQESNYTSSQTPAPWQNVDRSSPDYMHQARLNGKFTYNQHDRRLVHEHGRIMQRGKRSPQGSKRCSLYHEGINSKRVRLSSTKAMPQSNESPHSNDHLTPVSRQQDFQYVSSPPLLTSGSVPHQQEGPSSTSLRSKDGQCDRSAHATSKPNRNKPVSSPKWSYGSGSPASRQTRSKSKGM